MQELATIKRYNLPIKVVVLDNQCLGMVRQWQTFLGKRHSEVDLSDNPDFVQPPRPSALSRSSHPTRSSGGGDRAPSHP